MTDVNESSQSFTDRDQDEYVRQVRPDPAQPPQRGLDLTGLLGDSDRAGHRRLYFNRSLDYYAEFPIDDVMFVESVPPDEPPLVGLAATRVTLRRDAQITYARNRQATLDEFDLDVQLRRVGSFRLALEASDPRICRTIDICNITDVTCNTCLMCSPTSFSCFCTVP